MKKVILAAVAVFAFATGYSQEKDKFRGGLDLGYSMPMNGGGGILSDIEFKYNIEDNMNVGIKLGWALMAKNISTEGKSDGIDTELSLNGSYLGTFDYYFNTLGGSFVPFVGAGVGFYSLAGATFSTNIASENTAPSLAASNKFGGLIRGGFELGKFRLAIECNLIPSSKYTSSAISLGGTTFNYNLDADPNYKPTVQKISNSYFGFSLGFFLGGGKWGK